MKRMNKTYVYLSILAMAAVTYLIRVIPFLLFRKNIKNRFFRSFLTYAPYVTLSVMTFPAVFYCTGNFTTALVGTIVAILCNILKRGMLFTVVLSCLSVYLLQLIF